MTKVCITILGEPASKANSRRIVRNRRTGKSFSIKSDKAMNYTKHAKSQLTVLPHILGGDVSVSIDIFYASRRPDLDESIILDVMQGFIYKNDRQVKEKHIYWHLDKTNPRAEIEVTPL